MLLKNIFNIQLKMNKIISILLFIIILSSLIFASFPSKVHATYDQKFKNYPGYEALIKKLQEAHPNWEFSLIDTELDWSEAIIGESTGHHGLNVVPKRWGSGWQCGCTTATDPAWTCASTAAVAYYMDPRNSLNEDYIFQFEQLTFDKDIQTAEGVKTILSDCNYMQGKAKYYDPVNNKTVEMEKTYVDIIMEAAKEYNISPYHLASRIRQEQGPGNGTVLITGTWSGANGAYKGYYNYYNIQAYGKTDEAIITSGLAYAKRKGWNNPEAAIKGGAAIIVHDYIEDGQDTLYLQKFDVVPKNGYYNWQYMTNVSASKEEAKSVKSAYKEMGLLDSKSKIKFEIPVYKNMPANPCVAPGNEKMVTQDVEINAGTVNVRSGKGTNYPIIKKVTKGTKLLQIEEDNAKDSSGIYWDKVVLPDGTKGYISRQYLTKIDMQTNCNEKYITTAYTNFRNGPGTSKTTVIKLLSPNQIVTVVEKDKYKSVDGESWYRVKLSNGTYGYIGTGYMKVYDPSTMSVDTVKVVCSDGINIRKAPTTKESNIIKAFAKGTLLTRTEKNVKSEDSTYIWDKVTTSGGITGYVVRENPTTKQAWIAPINDEGEEKPEIQGEGFKSNKSSLICQPSITVANIKAKSPNAVIKKGDTVIKDTEKVGTGYTITADGKSYTIVVKGDVTGRGAIDTVDAARALKSAAGKYTLTGAYLLAADVTGDGAVDTIDAARILKAAAGKYKIVVD